MTTRKTLLVLFCSLVFPICPLLYGQATGSFSGTVTDKTGSVVSGANAKATAQGTGVTRESKTDDTGHYLMPLLPIGDYTIRVDSQGFGPIEQKDVRLQVDEHRELDFALSPASVTQAVEVSATEVAVQTTNPTLGQVITSQQVADLPLNGRNFVQLATLPAAWTDSARVLRRCGGRCRAGALLRRSTRSASTSATSPPHYDLGNDLFAGCSTRRWATLCALRPPGDDAWPTQVAKFDRLAASSTSYRAIVCSKSERAGARSRFTPPLPAAAT